MDAEIPTETLSLNEYAEYAGVSPRTVKRWLAANEVPDAYRDPFSREWRFPHGAPRVQRAVEDAAPNSFEVAVSGANGQMIAPPQWFPHPGEPQEDELTRLEMLDEESAFLTVERAARFLGVPQAQIRANAETFGLMKIGRAGRDGEPTLMVPKSTIRRFEGK